MTFIPMRLNDAKAKEVLPEGPYTLIAESAEYKEDKNCILIRHSVDGHPEAKAVFHNIWLPKEDADEDKINNTLLFSKAYMDLFGIDYNSEGFDTDAIPGAQGQCNLSQWTSDKGQTSNQIVLSV